MIGAALQQWHDDVSQKLGRTAAGSDSIISHQLFHDVVGLCNGTVATVLMLDSLIPGIRLPAKWFNSNVLEGFFGKERAQICQ